MLTIEEFLRLSNRLREYYGKQIKDRFSEYTFSPNEISILILLHIHYDKHTASCCTRCFKSFGFSKRNKFGTKGIDHNEKSFRKQKDFLY